MMVVVILLIWMVRTGVRRFAFRLQPILLGVSLRTPFLFIDGVINERWDYEDFKNKYVDTSEHLRSVMSKSQRMKVFVANGYFDLATPHLACEYTFSHMGLDPEIRKNVQMEYYDAGHMMYVHKPSLKKLAGDLRGFIKGSL
jgi:carboxypeptidase C (cathepsin A)